MDGLSSAEGELAGKRDGAPESLRRLEKALGDEISREEAVSLLAQAKQEARADVLSILRDMYKRALLDAAFAPADGQSRPESPMPVEAPESRMPVEVPGVVVDEAVVEQDDIGVAPTDQAGSDQVESDPDEIRREVAAIRQRLAENEAFLKYGPASMRDDEPRQQQVDGSSGDAASGGTAYYVYGIVRADESTELTLTASGVSPEQPVGLVNADGLAAVVSVVSLDEFGEDEIEYNLKDADWAEAKVRAHHEVLDELLSRGMFPVPLKFCTIFQELDRVQDMLREHRDEVSLALGRFAEKAEWGVKMFCDQATARRWVGGDASWSGAPKEETKDSAGAGAAYFQRKRMEKMLDEKVERLADEAAQACHDVLAGLAVDAVVLTLQGRETTGRTEAMLLNAAYLIGDEEFPGFEAAIDRLTQEWESFGCLFELTGPWPAYNFASVDAAEAVNE